MAKSVPYPRPLHRLVPVPLALVAIALCGCSINLGSLSPSSDDEAPKPAPAAASVADAQSHNSRGQALARSGKTEQALAEFDQAIAIDPNNADALYNRGLLNQADKQHQSAIEDFTAANGLTPQRAEPLLARAISFGAFLEPLAARFSAKRTTPMRASNPPIRANTIPRRNSAVRPAPGSAHPAISTGSTSTKPATSAG